MVRLTQSLRHWLFINHPKILPLIMLGHLELFTDKMQEDYLEWCQTEEGMSYLKGGSNYREGAEWMRNTKLKPCPFCGTLKQTIYYNGAGCYQVECDCGIQQKPYEHKKREDAIEAWNRRSGNEHEGE